MTTITTSKNLQKVANIIASTENEKLRIKSIEQEFKTVGLSGARIILDDARDMANGVISQAEFEYRLEQRIA